MFSSTLPYVAHRPRRLLYRAIMLKFNLESLNCKIKWRTHTHIHTVEIIFWKKNHINNNNDDDDEEYTGHTHVAAVAAADGIQVKVLAYISAGGECGSEEAIRERVREREKSWKVMKQWKRKNLLRNSKSKGKDKFEMRCSLTNFHTKAMLCILISFVLLQLHTTYAVVAAATAATCCWYYWLMFVLCTIFSNHSPQNVLAVVTGADGGDVCSD